MTGVGLLFLFIAIILFAEKAEFKRIPYLRKIYSGKS
jgi:hypothetical protein